LDRSQWWRSPDGVAARPRTGLRPEATRTRAPATASGPARAILELQRSVGNQAVARAIGGGALTPPAAKPVVVARQADTGLAAAKPTGSFAGAALAFWRSKANKQRPLTDFGDFLIAQVNDRLKALSVPPCSYNYDETEVSAVFSVVRWAIKLNPKAFASSSTVGSLSVREASARVGSVYHEARHAEQHFRVARVLAGQGKSATEIQQQTDMPKPQAALAAQAPLRGDSRKNRRLVAEAAGWIPFTQGRYELYEHHLRQLSGAAYRYFWGVGAWADVNSMDPDAESQRALHQKAVRVAWDDVRAIFDDYLEAKLREVEKLSRKSKVDQAVQRDLRKLWSVFTSLRQEIAKPHKTFASVSRQSRLAIEFYKLADRAYRNIAIEKDAFATGAAVTAAFRRKARR
jgi:hypothetical protein